MNPSLLRLSFHSYLSTPAGIPYDLMNSYHTIHTCPDPSFWLYLLAANSFVLCLFVNSSLSGPGCDNLIAFTFAHEPPSSPQIAINIRTLRALLKVLRGENLRPNPHRPGASILVTVKRGEMWEVIFLDSVKPNHGEHIGYRPLYDE